MERKKNGELRGSRLTDEGYGRGEAGSDVRGQTVLHGEPQVFQLALVEVGTRGGNVENRRDARGRQGLAAGRVDGAAEEEEGEQLHRTVLRNLRKSRDILRLVAFYFGKQTNNSKDN